MFPFPCHTTAVGLVADAWRRNLLDGEETFSGHEQLEVPVAKLAQRVADLAPEMSIHDREQFILGFSNIWPKIDAPGESSYAYGHDAGKSSDEEVALKCWLPVMASRRKPVASAERRPISAGDEVAYPREYEAMKLSPGDFGRPRPEGGRIRYVPRLSLTHRQLALHVEFAPLLAAVFLASRLPGGFFGGNTAQGPGYRPHTMTLIEVLLARRPDNVFDERFVPYVRWLVDFRFSLWPYDEPCIMG